MKRYYGIAVFLTVILVSTHGDGDPRSLIPRTLVMVELRGGNDSLNTIIPFTDEAYYTARPGLSIPASEVIPINADLGFHPEMAALLPLWESGQMAIIQGLGYPNPNRSHFRSIDIWETASDADEFRDIGWVAETGINRSENRAADAVVFGRGETPFSGSGLRVISMRNPEEFIRNAVVLETGSASGQSGSEKTSAELFLFQTAENTVEAAGIIAGRLTGFPEPGGFPDTELGRSLAGAWRLIASGCGIPVIKVSLGGFDTHANQAEIHSVLLAELAGAISAFQMALDDAGLSDSVTTITYSEFGRRVAENGSGGTDHGTSAAHLVIGGSVRGGLYGEAPSLTDLENGDQVATVHFRSLYRDIIESWWGLEATIRYRSNPSLGIFKN